MKHASLESGLGGFDYAAEMIGWENLFHCEINPFCQTILNYYWPHAKSYTDIFEFDAREWRGKVDVLTAGFPCQPFSHVGKRKGSKDDRHIWPENLRIIKEVQPPFVIAENVPGLLTIERGVVFETVCADLENEGYEVTPFIIPACAKGAVHRRDRIWIVADNKSWRSSKPGNTRGGRAGFEDSIADVADSGSKRQQGSGKHRRPLYTTKDENGQVNRIINGSKQQESWIEAATRLCRLDDGTTGRLDTKTISKSKWRTESLKAYGNAIYWPVAYEIFKAIQSCYTYYNN